MSLKPLHTLQVQASDAHRALYSYKAFQTDAEQFLYVALIMHIEAQSNNSIPHQTAATQLIQRTP